MASGDDPEGRVVNPRDGGGAPREKLVESGDLGREVLHPGGLEMTEEFARLCGVTGGSKVLDVASGTGEGACFLAEVEKPLLQTLAPQDSCGARSQNREVTELQDRTTPMGADCRL